MNNSLSGCEAIKGHLRSQNIFLRQLGQSHAAGIPAGQLVPIKLYLSTQISKIYEILQGAS